MNILVFNAGSASVKFAVFDLPSSDTSIVEAEFEHFEQGQSNLHYRLGTASDTPIQRTEPLANIEAAIKRIPTLLQEWGIKSLDAIGHRVVHGGTRFTTPVRIDAVVMQHIKDCSPLAPLHNPANLLGIELSLSLWPTLPQIAVFDTAFHQTLPDYAATYAVPQDWRDQGVRRYGFHGISHQYIAWRVQQSVPDWTGDLRLISCHLGNGASVCAILNGVSIDTSMGMTPLEGLVMGTRCGDLDPGIQHYLMRTLGLTAAEIESQLYHLSGLKGLSGSHDLREVEKQAAAGAPHAELALQVFAYRTRKTIGAYAAALGGVDVLAFTGGIGEHADRMRERICQQLGYLGVHLNANANLGLRLNGYEVAAIHSDTARVKVLVTRTREQWLIAKQVASLLLAHPTSPAAVTVPVAVSARHVHLSQAAVEALFGAGYALTKQHDLRQPGSWAAHETVTLIGPKGSINGVRVLGPTRAETQIEVSQTDAYTLGLDAPLRPSGQLTNTPSVVLRGSYGDLTTTGVIVAARHIHMHPDDAHKLELQDGTYVDVTIGNSPRGLVFSNTLVRISPQFITEMHIDTDEANAAGIRFQTQGELVCTDTHHGRILRC